MKPIIFAMLAMALGCGLANGQLKAGPDANGLLPDDTHGSNDSWTTPPTTYGGSAYGVALPGPDGQICVTTPALIGKPQYGNSTTCYRNGTQVPAKDTGAMSNSSGGTLFRSQQDSDQ